MATYRECAENWELWAEYVDPMGTMTQEEFKKTTVEEKIQICVDCFGPEDDLAHACESVTTPDGHGAYCKHCGETLA